MPQNSYRKSGLWPIIIFAVLLLFVAGCNNSSVSTGAFSPGSEANQPIPMPDQTAPSGQLKVHFLDVGQADSILVQLPNNQNMLIDAGNNDDGDKIINYLNKAGVKQIDYLVGTHPHEDHIGGMDTVIKNCTIGRVYMPRVTNTTRTYEDALTAVKGKGLKITTAKAGLKIVDDGSVQAVMLAPYSSEYEDLNNYSAVIKLTFGEVSFLFTGDTGEQSEAEILVGGISPQADVFKVGHHGSHSSTSAAFLQAVKPEYAVICIGAGNDYGHPHKETLTRLQGIKVFRTDLDGTVVFATDGREIKVTTGKNNSGTSWEPGGSGSWSTTGQNDNSISASNNDRIYVDDSGQGLIKGNINSKGEKIYHMPGEAGYANTKPEQWFKTEAEAVAVGFRPVND